MTSAQLPYGPTDFRPKGPAEPVVLEAVMVGQDGASEREPWLTIPNILRILRRRLLFICLGALLITGIGIALTLSVKPIYRAETHFVVDPRQQQISAVQEVISALPPEERALRSEVDVLKSSGLLRAVVQEARLHELPEFNPLLSDDAGLPWSLLFWLDGSAQGRLRDLVRDVSDTIRARLGFEAGPALEPDTVKIAIEHYRRRLNVSNDGRSLTLRLAVDSHDPELAARLANLHAELYLFQQLDSRLTANERAHGWLAERTEKLKADLQAAEAAAQRYREDHQLLISGAGTTLIAQQLGELNTQLTLARADKAQSAARLQQVRDLIRTGSALESVPEVLESPIILRLREHEGQLRRAEAEGLSRYANASHPMVIGARAQLQEVRTQIRGEIAKIAASLERSVEVASARERSLVAGLQDLTERAAVASQAEVKLRELEREAEATRGLYLSFLKRLYETSVGPARLPDARVISSAAPPMGPAWPHYNLFFLISGIVGAAVSTGLAFLIEANQDRLRSPLQFDNLVGVKGLGLVPQVKQRQIGPITRIADHVVDRNGHMSRDAVRAVLELMFAGSPRNGPYTALITSTVPHEGKTVLSIWLARVSAMAGYKVLLIDADLRRPAVARSLGMDRGGAQNGAELPLSEIVREDPATGMHYLTCQNVDDRVFGRASLNRIQGYLEDAKKSYDLVFIDSAPVLAAPEVLSMCQMADGVVFAVRWGHTPAKQVFHAVRMLESVKAKVAGTVVTRADVRKHPWYGFGDVGDVYRAYGGYYGRS